MKIAPPIADSLASVFGIRKPSDGDPPESRSFQPSMWPDFLASEPGRPVRVILIDDVPHIRRVIAGELVSDMRIDMVGQADSLRDGRRLISMCEFDVMIVDLNLGDGSGFDLIEHMKQVRPQAEAIVVSIMDDEVRACAPSSWAPPAIWSRTPGLAASHRRCCRCSTAVRRSPPVWRVGCC
jgi:CheY-like chemotaxis protein